METHPIMQGLCHFPCKESQKNANQECFAECVGQKGQSSWPNSLPGRLKWQT
jgi:hypothetical protein